MPRNCIVAAFEEKDDALVALRELRSHSFSPRRLGIIAPGKEGDDLYRTLEDLEGTQAGPAAGVGAAVGATAGAAAALGTAAGILPGVGPIIAGGALVSLVMQALAGGATGTLVGTLVGLGIADRDAVFYERELARGRAIVIVDARTPAEVATAFDVLTDHNGYQRRIAA